MSRPSATLHGHGKRGGFTLLEVIIAVAIIAVLAGAITPLAYREMVAAREEATLKELAAIERGLTDFYEDTGRFPTEAEGLAALLADPGAPGWQGPYVGTAAGDPVTELTTDAFNRVYAYDVAPTTAPAGAADVIVASGGQDLGLDLGGVGSTWDVDGVEDDLLALVSIGPLNRAKIRDCTAEMEAIGAAERAHFEDNASFTTDFNVLVPTYLDGGVGAGAVIDPWNVPYQVFVTTAGATPPLLTVRSRGPNQVDDGGAGDDISLSVSSVAPGRTTSLWRLEIAQTALNNNPAQALTGVWANDRAALGLAAAFTLDGWGRSFAVNVASRTVYSVGPDGNAALTADNLPAGVGP